ncbi:MAG: hypothetical protein R3E12_14670 [Candidatus Eisenbacteria bacterium]
MTVLEARDPVRIDDQTPVSSPFADGAAAIVGNAHDNEVRGGGNRAGVR